ncbi:MAG: hydrogenase subunit MbhD domain-containing protein [Gemmatimonadota bacterium]|nr:hydrogenase subunit MbhD domain-containing protein [Gemmatimonadota bacterium]
MTVTGVDPILAVALLLLAGGAVGLPGLFRSIVLYVAFGLVLVLVWVRLGVPDIGLAEVALAAGVTGVLLMVSLREAEDVDIDLPWEDDRSAHEDLGD